MTACVASTLILIGSPVLMADVRTEQRDQVKFEGMLGRVVGLFGGKAAREGVKSSVAVQGSRKATLNDSTGQIIDLGEEKIYELDIRRKTYSVTTFAALRARMEEARRKAEEGARKEQEKPAEPAPSADQPQLEVDFDVKETGQSRAINGFETRQVVMTIALREKGKTIEDGGLVLTADSWLAPTVAALREIAEFDLRFAQQLAGPMLSGASIEQMAAALAMYPGLKEGLARMRAESAKLEGTPILTTVTMEAVKSAEQIEAERKNSEERSRPGGGVGGLVGGLARRAIRKEEAPKPRATVMTSTSEVLSVSTTVGAGDVAVPAGFKEAK
jgi:hypothetical protein